MNRCILLFAACAGLTAAPALAQDRAEGPRGSATGRGSLRGYANPSAVIAAELALARDAAARGRWTALDAAAASDAVVFAPRLVWARPWLKGRANPAPAMRWQPAAVWSSCDGSLMVSRSSWRAADGSAGWLARVWQRQGDGAYKWVAELDGRLGQAAPESDMIAAEVADCAVRVRSPEEDETRRLGKPPKPPRPPKLKDLPPLDPMRHGGAAGDGTLRWEASVAPDGARRLVAIWRKDGREQTLIDERVTGG